MNPYIICALITVASALTSLGFSVQAALGSDRVSQVNAFYAASRSIALAIAAIAALFIQSVPFLVAIAGIMIVVQVLDAVIGLRIHSALKTYGPGITALFNLIALVWLIN